MAAVKRAIKSVVYKIQVAVFEFGGFRLSKFFSRNFPKILMYHRFGPSDDPGKTNTHVFSEQMQLLKTEFNVISLLDLVDKITKKEPIPENSIVVTIDDGYLDFYEHAYPVLKELNFPATIYVVSDFIDQKLWLWPDAIDYILKMSTMREVTSETLYGSRTFELTNDKQKRVAWNDIADYCLTLEESDKWQLINSLAEKMEVGIPARPVPEYRAMDWGQLSDMKENNIEIASHTCTHPKLTMCNKDQANLEIKKSKSRIEEMLGERVYSFCYPNGTEHDYNEEIKSLVKEAGYSNSTVAYFDARMLGDRFELRRFSVNANMEHFKKSVYGVFHAKQILRHLFK